MRYGRSMLRGYDKSTAKLIAAALHISDYVPSKGGGKMKIPMSLLKSDKKATKAGGKMKMSMLKKDKKEDK